MSEAATVGQLRALLEKQFSVPDADQTLSLDPQLVSVAAPPAAAGTHALRSRGRARLRLRAPLTPRPSRACQLLAPSTSAFSDLSDPRATLRSRGIQHGSLVYLRYTVERRVTPTPGVETRPFGAPPAARLSACARCVLTRARCD